MDTTIATSEQGIMRLGVDKAVRARRMRSHFANTEPAIDTTCSNFRPNSNSSCTMVTAQLQTYFAHELPSSTQMDAEQNPRFLWAPDDVARSLPFS